MRGLTWLLLLGLLPCTAPQLPQGQPVAGQQLPQQGQLQHGLNQGNTNLGKAYYIPGQPNVNLRQPNGIPGQHNGVPGQPNGIPWQPIGTPGQPNSIPGQPNSIPGQPNGIPEQPNGIPEQPNGIPGQPNSIPGQPNGIPGQPNGIAGQPNGIPGQPNGIPGQPNGIPGQPNGILRQPNGILGLPNGIPEQPNIIPGQPNGIPRQPKGIPGQPNSIPGQPNGIPGQPNGIPGQPNGIPGQPNGNLGQPNGIPGQPNGIAGQPNGIPGQPNGIPGQPNGIPGQPNGILRQPNGILGLPNGIPGQPILPKSVYNTGQQSVNSGQLAGNVDNFGQHVNDIGQMNNQQHGNWGQPVNNMGQINNQQNGNVIRPVNNMGQMNGNLGQPQGIPFTPRYPGQQHTTLVQPNNQRNGNLGQPINNMVQINGNLGQPPKSPLINILQGQRFTTMALFNRPGQVPVPADPVQQLPSNMGQPYNGDQLPNQMGKIIDKVRGGPNAMDQFGNNNGQQPGPVGQSINNAAPAPNVAAQFSNGVGQQPNLIGQSNSNVRQGHIRAPIATTMATIKKPFECKANIYNENLALSIPAKPKEVLKDQFLRTECQVHQAEVSQIERTIQPVMAQFPLENRDRLVPGAPDLCGPLPAVGTTRGAGTFQVMDPDSKLYAYSAYYDARLEERAVRVWALAPFRGVPVFCQLACDGQPNAHVRRAVVEFIKIMVGADTNCAWNQFLINCPWSQACIPTRVSITRTPCGTPHGVLPVQPLGHMDSAVPLTNIICTSTIFDYNDEDVGYLAEFVEFYKLYGVEKVFLYDTYNVSSGMEQLLQFYEKQGFIVRVPWRVPEDVSYLYYFGQMLQYNDCIYRNMDTAKYIGLFDFDDIFFPGDKMTWTEALNKLSNAWPSGHRIASYKFPWSTVCPGKSTSKDPYVRPPSSRRTISSRLANFQVVGKFHQELKQIVVPRRIFRVHVHGVHFKWPGYGEINTMSTDYGVVYHYGADQSHCKNLNSHIEIKVCQRLPQIEVNVARVLAAAGLIVTPTFLGNLPLNSQSNNQMNGVPRAPVQSLNNANVPNQIPIRTTGKALLPGNPFIPPTPQFLAQKPVNLLNPSHVTPLYHGQDRPKTTRPPPKVLHQGQFPGEVNPHPPVNIANALPGPPGINLQRQKQEQANSQTQNSGFPRDQNSNDINKFTNIVEQIPKPILGGTQSSRSLVSRNTSLTNLLKQRVYVILSSLFVVFIVSLIIRKYRKTLNRPLRQIC